MSTTQRVVLKKCVRLNLRSTARISEHYYYAHPPFSRRARLLHFFEYSSPPTRVINSSLCRVYRTCEVSASNLRQFPFYDVISETSLLLGSRWIRTCLHGESRRAHPAKVTRYELGHVRKSILTPDRRIAIIFHLCRLDEQIDFRCQTCRQSRQSLRKSDMLSLRLNSGDIPAGMTPNSLDIVSHGPD